MTNFLRIRRGAEMLTGGNQAKIPRCQSWVQHGHSINPLLNRHPNLSHEEIIVTLRDLAIDVPSCQVKSMRSRLRAVCTGPKVSTDWPGQNQKSTTRWQTFSVPQSALFNKRVSRAGGSCAKACRSKTGIEQR